MIIKKESQHMNYGSSAQTPDWLSPDELDQYGNALTNVINPILIKAAGRLKMVLDNGVVPIGAFTNQASAQWALLHTDFRSLVLDAHLEAFLYAMRDDGGEALSHLIRAHQSISILVPMQILKQIKEQILDALTDIPYPVGEDDAVTDMATVLRTYPVVWVAVLMQIVLWG